jgi:DNA-binding Lrp family transcriptional regulator
LTKKIQSATDDIKRNRKNTKLENVTPRRKVARSVTGFDKIDIMILGELLKNSNVKSSDISNKLKIPLSTIQRRRARIENSSRLKRTYEIDYEQFGLRKADILVTVSKGDCIDVANKIATEYTENILEISIRIGDPKVNLVSEVVYSDSDEIFNMIQNIKRMEHVEDARWSEIIKAVVKGDAQVVQRLMSKSVGV